MVRVGAVEIQSTMVRYSWIQSLGLTKKIKKDEPAKEIDYSDTLSGHETRVREKRPRNYPHWKR